MTQKEAIAAIRKKHGKESIIPMGQGGFDVERISSGILPLDWALGGGIPLGRVMEIYGPESAGKTTIALYVALAAQQVGKNVAFIDLENALDPVFAEEVVGLDIDKMLMSQPDSAEKALDIVIQLIELNGADLIILDSVAALAPRAEIEGDMGDSHMGLVARLMSQALRKITAMQITQQSNTTVLFINQLRENIGGYGSPETTPGGRALKFYSSVRMDVRSNRAALINSADQGNIGKRITVKVVKNKVAPPFKQAEFDLYYDTGIDPIQGLFEVAVKLGIIGQKGAFYFDDNGEKLGQGQVKTIAYIKENPDYAAEVRTKVLSSPTKPRELNP
jgi:recombination protein RecA